MPKSTRRDFLKLVTNALFSLSGMLGLGGLVRFFSYQPAPGQPTEFDLGEVADFPASSRTVRRDIPAVIYNTKGAYSAYSLTCTHLGCIVEEDGDSFACPCHGSRFAENGVSAGRPGEGAAAPVARGGYGREYVKVVYKVRRRYIIFMSL